jgi:hypothetical protein
MLQFCGPAAEKQKVLKSWFYLKKALPMLRKMPQTAPC